MLPALSGSLRVVMFDLDGTLVDTMAAFADLAADVMVAQHGAHRAVARHRYLETSGIPFHQQLEVIYPLDARNAEAAAEFERRKRAVCDATMMDRATVAGLVALRQLGLRLVVSSNAHQGFVDQFATREAFGFDLTLGFDPSRGLAKGEAHVAHTCRELAVTRRQILFIGDSLKDAELAERSQVAFAGRLGTFTDNEFRARDPYAITIGNVVELSALLRARDAA